MDELGVMISQAVDGSLVLTRPGGAQVALTAPEVALIRALPLSLNGATQAEALKLRATGEILQRWDAEGMPPRRASPDPDDEPRRGKTPDEVFDSVESLVDASRSCARVVLDLRVDGSVLIVATCCGAPDSKYAPMAAERVPVEVSKLLTELRNRVVNLRASR